MIKGTETLAPPGSTGAALAPKLGKGLRAATGAATETLLRAGGMAQPLSSVLTWSRP